MYIYWLIEGPKQGKQSTLKLQLQQKINEVKRGYKEALDYQECIAGILETIYGA